MDAGGISSNIRYSMAENHQKAPGTLLYKDSGHILVGEFLYHHRRKPTLIVIRIGRVEFLIHYNIFIEKLPHSMDLPAVVIQNQSVQGLRFRKIRGNEDLFIRRGFNLFK